MHQDGGVAFGTVVSFLGYCLLPVVLLAAASIVVSSSSVPGQVLGGLAVLASTCTSTRLFEAKLHMRPQRYLIAYPLALIYSCFVLITIFWRPRKHPLLSRRWRRGSAGPPAPVAREAPALWAIRSRGCRIGVNAR